MINTENLQRPLLENLLPPVPEYVFPDEANDIHFDDFLNIPENGAVLQKISTMNIQKILTSSANGYRGASDRALADLIGVECRFVPGISDELEWGVYRHYCEIVGQHPNVLDYQKLVAMSKYFRVRAAPDEHLLTHGVVNEDRIENHTLFIATDTIIWNWTDSGYLPMEKPKDENEAVFQAWTLSRGVPFVVSNATWTGMMSDRYGRESSSFHLQPLRFNVNSKHEADRIADIMLDEYFKISDGTSKWGIVPGVITKTHPDLARHLLVGLGRYPTDNILGEDDGSFYMPNSTYRWNVHKQGDLALKKIVDHKLRKSEVPFLNLQPSHRTKVGLAIGGVSLDGKMEAVRRLPQQSMGYENTNRKREKALHALSVHTTFEDLPHAHPWG